MSSIPMDSTDDGVTELDRETHRRLNPLTLEWVLVSPRRTSRPWRGGIEKIPSASVPGYDPECYLCPGNERANGQHNPQYSGTFAFDNDFPALTQDTRFHDVDLEGILIARAEPGICRVLCFTPRHNKTLGRLDSDELFSVISAWRNEFVELGAHPEIGAVQIFENRGEMMGASNPHPHGQIWGTASIPNEVMKETSSLRSSFRKVCLLCEYAKIEGDENKRTVYSNAEFLVVVPFWATWPFETMILPRRHLTGLDALDDDTSRALADALSVVAVRYDNLFETPFAYSMGVHQRPTDGGTHEEWHLHLHFYPPLLRSATIRKFMVGFELLAEPQRDISAEEAAAHLRNVDSRHYLERRGN
jgi:UDPglucose--hexose-1-phosphate uridylyltransferase